MTALQVIDKTVLYDTLVSITEVQALVGAVDVNDDPYYKIYWEHVEMNVPLPYIVLTHIMGRRDKDNSYSRTTWKIVGVTTDLETAEDLANAISKLDHMSAVTSAYSTVCDMRYIEETLPIFDRFQVQNLPIFMVGGMYELMLNLGDE